MRLHLHLHLRARCTSTFSHCLIVLTLRSCIFQPSLSYSYAKYTVLTLATLRHDLRISLQFPLV